MVEVEVGFELLLKPWLEPLWTLPGVTRDSIASASKGCCARIRVVLGS